MTQPTTPTQTGGTRGRLFDVFFASFGFLILRFALGPVRIKLLTSLLSKDEYGTLTVISTTVSAIVLCSSIGSLEYLFLKMPGRDREFQQGRLKTIMLFFGGIACLVALVGMPVLGFWPGRILGLGVADILACGMLLILSAHLSHRSYYLLGTMNYSRSRVVQLLFTDLWFVPVILFLGYGRLTVGQMLWIWVFWYLLTSFITHRWMAMREVLRASATRESLVEVLRFGWPLMPMIAGDLLTRIQDRYVLLGFTDIGTVASYTLAVGIAMIGVQMGDAALDLLVTEFFRVRNRIQSHAIDVLAGEEALRFRFTVMVRYCMVIALGAGLAEVFLPESIVRFMSSIKFLDAAKILPWLAPMTAAYLLFIIFGKVCIALNRNREMGWAAFVTAFLNLGANFILIPLWGPRGAAVAATLSLTALSIYLGCRIEFWRWIDWRAMRAARLAALFVIGACIFFMLAGWSARPFVKLLSAGTAYLGIVGLLGLFTREDMDLFLRRREPINPGLAAASDEREIL
jgi:O-antigen/teichoic acid export membrane protein